MYSCGWESGENDPKKNPTNPHHKTQTNPKLSFLITLQRDYVTPSLPPKPNTTAKTSQ